MTLWRRFRQMRVLLILVGVVLALAYTAFGRQIDNLLSPTCSDPFPVASGLTDEHRAQLDILQDAGLLYCPPIPPRVVGLPERAYWGSDGVNSIVYIPVDSPASYDFADYTFDDIPAQYVGDKHPVGYRPPGRPIYRNEAPDDAAYFFLLTGAPLDVTSSVSFRLGGEAVPSDERDRDFFEDLESIWDRIRGVPEAVRARGTARVVFPISTPRYEDLPVRWVNPDLISEGRSLTDSPFLEIEVTEPTLWQHVSGPLGSGVWVAGVVSGTRPSLILSPESGEAVTPSVASSWSNPAGTNRLALFAFPPLPGDVAYSAVLRDDSETVDEVVLGPFSFGNANVGAAATPAAAP